MIKKRWRMNKERMTAILMLLPSVILLGVFVYGFIIQTAYSSFTDWQGLTSPGDADFIGLENYRDLFSGLLNARFRQSLVNTLFFTIFFIIGCISLGLTFAILLDQGVRFEGFFRLIFLYPMSLSFIVTGTVWRWLFNPGGGINRLPEYFGLDPIGFRWLTDRSQIWKFDWNQVPRYFGFLLMAVLVIYAYRYWRKQQNIWAAVFGLISVATLAWLVTGGADKIQILPVREEHGFNVAMIGIIIAAIWQMAGYVMAMYLAGIRGISDELREAARVDGANEIQVYQKIILPLLQPITLSAMIVLGHISLKIFDLIFVMTGPDYSSTDVPGTLMFVTSFRGNQFATGAAIAIVMLILVAMVIIPYLVTTLRSEHEL
ncbi:MAG: sugar ABC transporter permease [Anaerolineales bacterium]|nr:sugar ABC transporter permease [Anaerolineales bacterium]